MRIFYRGYKNMLCIQNIDTLMMGHTCNIILVWYDVNRKFSFSSGRSYNFMSMMMILSQLNIFLSNIHILFWIFKYNVKPFVFSLWQSFPYIAMNVQKLLLLWTSSLKWIGEIRKYFSILNCNCWDSLASWHLFQMWQKYYEKLNL